MGSKLFIIAAPSGAGKNTFINRLINENQDRVVHSISFTTRSPREGESEGHPYHFRSVDQFENLIEEDYFAEWAKVHKNYYGTSKEFLENLWAENKWVVMDIDVKGAQNLKNIYPDAVSFFILPPSVDVLRQRLLSRPGKTDDVELRLANAVDEMLSAPEFDYQITNDNFEEAYAEFQKIIEKYLQNQ
ncbi:MAG: guanylate kinase [Bdellovibrionales bacterium]